MSRVIVIAMREKNERTGVSQLVASHGMDEETLEAVVLPGVHPTALGAKWDLDLGEWVLEEPSK